jgi:hypothetical protein
LSKESLLSTSQQKWRASYNIAGVNFFEEYQQLKISIVINDSFAFLNVQYIASSYLVHHMIISIKFNNQQCFNMCMEVSSCKELIGGGTL